MKQMGLKVRVSFPFMNETVEKDSRAWIQGFKGILEHVGFM